MSDPGCGDGADILEETKKRKEKSLSHLRDIDSLIERERVERFLPLVELSTPYFCKFIEIELIIISPILSDWNILLCR